MNMDDTGRPGASRMGTEKAQGSRQNSDMGAMQDLKPFADQLMSIAKQLREGDFHSLPAAPEPDADTASKPATLRSGSIESQGARVIYARRARAAYSRRRQRGSIFGNTELFGEPAWDILLDLYIAHVDEKPVSVSSACIGSASPPTTGLRWLGVLAENNLVIREQDPNDQRRVLVKLTEFGVEAMDRYFASVDGSE